MKAQRLMKVKLASIALSFYAFNLCFSAIPDPDDQSRLGVNSSEMKVICSNNAHSYQMLLHEVSHRFWDKCPNKSWSDIKPILLGQYPKVFEHNPQWYTFLILEDAFNANGVQHDLYLDIQIKKDNIVANSNPYLLCKVNANGEALINKHPYEHGSVVEVLFRTKQFKADTANFPIIKSLNISYGGETESYREYICNAFFVVVELGSPTGASEKMMYYAESGLDPLDDGQGHKIARKIPRGDVLIKKDGTQLDDALISQVDDVFFRKDL